MVVKEKSLRYLVTIMMLLILSSCNEGKDRYQSFEFNGKVETVIPQLEGERGFYICVNDVWYNIVNLKAQEFVQKGDSICKKQGENHFTFYRNKCKSLTVSNSIIHTVNSSRISYKIDRKLGKF